MENQENRTHEQAGEAVIQSSFIKKLDNFWYHHKWKTIIISGGCPRLPERPSLCKNAETLCGESICNILSSLPISTPSSKVTVAQVTA